MKNITQSERDRNWEELKKRIASQRKTIVMDWGDDDKQTQKTPSVSARASAPDIKRAAQNDSGSKNILPDIKKAGSAPTVRERALDALSSIGKKTVATTGILAKGAATSVYDKVSNVTNDKYQQAKDRRVVLEQRLADSAYDIHTDEGILAPGGEAVTEQAVLRNAIEMAKKDEEKHKTKTVIDNDHWAMKLYGSGVADEQKAMEGLSDNAKQVFGIGLSVADMALTLPTAAVSPAVPVALMSAKAAAGKTYDLSQKGVEASEALARGLVSGGIEYMTGKLPIDNIINAVKIGGRPVVNAMLKQMGSEATEESVSYMLNHIADVAAQDPDAEFSVNELLMSAVGGAVSGGIFGAGSAALGNAGRALKNNEANMPKTPKASDNSDVPNIPKAVENSVSDGNITGDNVVTRIADVYEGDVPVQQSMERTSVNISEENAQKADTAWKSGKNVSEQTREGFKKTLGRFGESVFNRTGGERNITVNGMTFDGKPYDVIIDKSIVNSVIKDAESSGPLALLYQLDDVVSNASYVGSSNVSNGGKRITADIIRYDAFETNIDISGKSTVVTFDVAVGRDGRMTVENMEIADHITNIAEPSADNTEVVGELAEELVVESDTTPILTNDQVKGLYAERKRLEEMSKAIEADIYLSPREEGCVQALLDGVLLPGELPNGPDVDIDNVMTVYNAKKALLEVDGDIGRHNKRLADERIKKASNALENVGEWKDKSMGILYQRETMERNFRDIIPDKAEAESIISEYITPVHKNEANSNRLKNTMRKVVKDLGLSNAKNYYVEYMNGETIVEGPVSESTLVQLLGENKITEIDVVKSGADLQKIKGAVNTFRSIYNGLINQMNDVLIANGYAPVDYRKDYFPHFEIDQPDSLFLKAAKVLGFELQTDSLPTDLAGRTHEFRPGKSWFRNALRRTGVRTEYDAVKGFDMYIEGVSNVIHHTEDIRKLRALEDELRYITSDEATRKMVDEIKARKDIDELEKGALIAEVYHERLDRTQMANLAVELRRYGDNLANKKSAGDRDMEQKIGRIFYDASKKVQGRVSSNMVAVNPSSWLTNFIPITQGMSSLSHGDAVKAMGQALRNTVKDDGFVDRSAFLTNRRGSDFLAKTKIEKAGDIAASPMFYIDDFVANALVRGKYNENIRNGMNEMSAIDNADAFAASIMADRSKGALPSIFNERNPITKLFTTFQVEVNNQLSYVMKDLPRISKEEQKDLAAGVVRMFAYAFLYNQIYEYFVGRRPALDPIDMAFSFVKDVADTETPLIDDMTNLGLSALEQVPFVGGVMGGGRLPISSALPDIGNLSNIMDSNVSPEKKGEIALKEGSKVAAYFLVPFGGGQAKKTLESLSAYAQGGSYTYDNEGNRKLRFPVEQTAGNAVKGALFGQYSYDTAQDYVDDGFKMYSAKDTAIIDSSEDNGFTREEIIDIIDGTKGMNVEDTRQYIFDLPMSGSEKQKVYGMLFDGKSNIDFSDETSFRISSYFSSANKQTYAKSAIDAGIDVDKVLRFYEEQKDIDDLVFQGKTVANSRRKAVERACMKYGHNEAQFIALMRLAGYSSYDSEDYKMRRVPS